MPDADATAVARMRAAGAIVLGKTNTPEFTLSFETDNLVYGQTNNPYDVSRTPGGSSGGASAIIAAGGSAMDLGTDTGGSIRVPSAFCGLAGLKPTSGRVPRTGHIVPWGLGGMDSLTTIGPMARYVEDLWLGFSTIAWPDGIDPFIHPVPVSDPACINVVDLRVAFYTDNGTVTPTAEVEAAVRSAAEAIADSGAQVVEDLPAAITDNVGANITSILVADGGAGVRRLVDKAGAEQVHPRMERFLNAEPISTAEYTALLEGMAAIPKRDALIHGELRRNTFPCTSVASAATWRDAHFRGQSCQLLYERVQHNRLARRCCASRHLVRWPANRRAGDEPSVARRRSSRARSRAGVGARRVCQARAVGVTFQFSCKNRTWSSMNSPRGSAT